MTHDFWYKDAIFYQVYIRAFRDSNGDGKGDLRGLEEKLDYFTELGVTCLWLMPIYPSPLKDDGYDIADYYGIHQDYGNLDDFKSLLAAAHERGLRVITDLALNHTSDQHPWFQAARANPNSIFRDYYVWSSDEQKFCDARIIFQDTETSNWAWDEQSRQFYWHRFYASQPDLNYDNPRVQDEILKVISFWLDLGVDGFRADAVPYLFEREGTNCENLPETHAFLKKIRRHIDRHYPGRLLLAEANQWPQDLLPYFGNGKNEFHMSFHFPLMPRIFMALHQRRRDSLVSIMEQTPRLPDTNQWCLFLRNHDELTLEMVTDEERRQLWDRYAPDPRMRLNVGIRRRLAPLLDNDVRKIRLAHSLLFTLPGSPILYYGDEIGMGDNIWLSDRNGVRTPMQWNAQKNAGFSDAPPDSLYAPIVDNVSFDVALVNVEKKRGDSKSLWNALRRMIAVRKQSQIFSRGKFEWLDCQNEGIAAYRRFRRGQSILALHNLTDTPQPLTFSAPPSAKHLRDLLTDKIYPCAQGRCELMLNGYQYLWLGVNA